jgi:hypothetical protein
MILVSFNFLNGQHKHVVIVVKRLNNFICHTIDPF